MSVAPRLLDEPVALWEVPVANRRNTLAVSQYRACIIQSPHPSAFKTTLLIVKLHLNIYNISDEEQGRQSTDKVL